MTASAVLRSFAHNVIAHPLLFVGDLGEWLHDITAPEGRAGNDDVDPDPDPF